MEMNRKIRSEWNQRMRLTHVSVWCRWMWTSCSWLRKMSSAAGTERSNRLCPVYSLTHEHWRHSKPLEPIVTQHTTGTCIWTSAHQTNTPWKRLGNMSWWGHASHANFQTTLFSWSTELNQSCQVPSSHVNQCFCFLHLYLLDASHGDHILLAAAP